MSFYELQSNKMLKHANSQASLDYWTKKGEGVAIHRYTKIFAYLSQTNKMKEIEVLIHHFSTHRLFTAKNVDKMPDEGLQLFQAILSAPDERVISLFFSKNPFLGNRDLLKIFEKTKNFHLLNYIKNSVEIDKNEILAEEIANPKRSIQDFEKVKYDRTYQPFLWAVCSDQNIGKDFKKDLIFLLLESELKDSLEFDESCQNSLKDLLDRGQKEIAKYIVKFASIPINDLMCLVKAPPIVTGYLLEIGILSKDVVLKNSSRYCGFFDAALYSQSPNFQINFFNRAGMSPHQTFKLYTDSKGRVHFSKCTPFILICKLGTSDFLDKMIKQYRLQDELNKETSYRNEIPLFVALDGKRKENAIPLIQNGAKIDRDLYGMNPFFTACESGLTQVVEEMLLYKEKDAVINLPIGKNNETPITVACKGHHSELAIKLLVAGACPFTTNNQNESAYSIACKNGDVRLLREIMKHSQIKENIDKPFGSDKLSPLQAACDGGHVEVAIELIKNGANPFHQFESEFSAYFCACREGLTKVVEHLGTLSDFAKYRDGTSSNGMTPVYWACAFEQAETAIALLKLGADPFKMKKNGQSAYYMACIQGLDKVVEEIVKHPRFEDFVDQRCEENGVTPLLQACFMDRSNIALQLVKKNANPFVSAGKSPYFYAYTNRMEDVLFEIQKHKDFSSHHVEVTYVVDNSDQKEPQQKKYLIPNEIFQMKSSPYFKQFGKEGSFKEQQSKNIHVQWSYPSEALEAYFQHDIEVTHENFKALTHAAHYFQDELLLNELLQFVKNHPDVANWKKHLVTKPVDFSK